MYNDNDDFILIINNICKSWVNNYTYYTKKQRESPNEVNYLTQFSKITNDQIIPRIVVKVYFTFSRDQKANDKFNLTYKFENDELIHKLGNTVNISMLESWIERYIKQKESNKERLFLATEFEETRIKDNNLEKLKKDVKIIKFEPEKYWIEEGLNNKINNILYEKFDYIQKNNFNIIKKISYLLYRIIDMEDIGYISNTRCLEFLSYFGIDINKADLFLIFEKNNFEKTGFINYASVNKIIINVIFGFLYKKKVVEYKEKEEEINVHISSLMVIQDNKKEHIEEIISECTEREIEEGLVSKDVFDNIFWSFSEFFTESDKKTINDIVSTKLCNTETNMVDYKKLKREVIMNITNNIADELCIMKTNKFEKYIYDILEKSELSTDMAIDIRSKKIFDIIDNLDKVKIPIIQKYIICHLFKDFTDLKSLALSLTKYFDYLFDDVQISKNIEYYELSSLVNSHEYIKLYEENQIYNICKKIFKTYNKDNNGKLIKSEFIDYLNDLNLISIQDKFSEQIFDYFDKETPNYITENEFIEYGFNILKYKFADDAFMLFLNNFVINF